MAELARLKLSDNEVTNLQKDISNILDYVAQVSDVSTRNVAKDQRTASLLRNVMRDDAPRTEGDVLAGKEEKLRAAFPKHEGNYNVVRKIIQKDE